MPNGINGIYVPGPISTDAQDLLQEGFYINAVGGGTVSAPVGPGGQSFADTVSFYNAGADPVRITITPDPGYAGTINGSLSALILPGHSWQKSFEAAIIQDVQLDAVDLPAAPTTGSVSALTANAGLAVVGILNLVEN